MRKIGSLTLFLLLLLVTITAQPEHRDDKYKDDPHAYCYKGPEEGSAHACACVMVCGPDAAGNPVQQETTSCSMYCSRSRCACHSDEACGEPEPL